MTREQVKVGKRRWTKLNDQEYVRGQWRITLREQDTAIFSPEPNYQLLWTVYEPGDASNGEGSDWFDTLEEAVKCADRLAIRTDANCPYKSIKEAKADGWVPMKDAFYGGEMLLIKGHRLTRNHKVAISGPSWEEKGCEVFHPTPHATISWGLGRGMKYDIYREDQVRPIRE